MATGGSNTNMAQEDSANKLTCAICLESYRGPKLLPCFHTFCQRCLQGVAGSSPSFPCPSCRTLVLLPPGGVGALQTNFYIADDVASSSSSSSPPRRLCDVCTDDREATHSCLQCRQRFCLPCRNNHDSFTACRGHTVVPLTPETGEGCGKGILLSDNQAVEMCPKHPGQQLLLHCNTCHTDLCLQCKLTQHEGHPTEDLVHTRAKVKDKLRDRLGALTREIQQMDHFINAFEDRCSKLQQQKQVTEQEFKVHADTLHQWVNQSLEDALTSVQVSAEQLCQPWQDQAEQLANRKTALQAQQGHILRVLKKGQEAEVMSLEAQLSSVSLEDVDVKQLHRELTQKIPTWQVGHSATAVNQPQLRAFIGVLEGVHQRSGNEQSSVPMATTSIQGKASGSGDVQGSGLNPRTGSSQGEVGVKEPARQIIYSKNPESRVYGVCLISHNRLWVMYRFALIAVDCAFHLKLFSAEGQVLTTVESTGSFSGFLPITDDTVLCWTSGDSQVQLLTPDGSLDTYDMGTQVRSLVSRGSNGVYYLREHSTRRVSAVKFALTDQVGSAESNATTSPSKSPHTLSLKKRLTHSVLEVVFSEMEGVLGHVSAGGRYFASFSYSDTVCVYGRSSSQTPVLICRYQLKARPTAVRFCQTNGREMLLVATRDGSKVDVIDHTDGGHLVCYLGTGALNVDRPCRLTTDCDNQHLWIGYEGGKVVCVDL